MTKYSPYDLLSKPALPRKSLKTILCFMATGLTSLLSSAHAADIPNYFELSPEQLFGASVTSASKTEEKLLDAPAAIYVLTSEDILRSGATSIPEALRLVPGVQVARVNNNGWAISVRGFNSGLANKLLVLIDGREVYDPLFSGVYWDTQDTVLADIERIEIIRGPGAALWGANAVNGVINIMTKNAKDTTGGLVSSSFGNQERALSDVRYGGKIGENGYYRIYGKYINRASQERLTGGSAGDEWQGARSGFRADWKDANTNSTYTVQGDIYENSAGQFRRIPLPTAPYSSVQKENIDSGGGNILGRWNRELSDDSRFTLQSYVDYIARDQLLVSDRRTSFDIDGHWELPTIEQHKIIVGGKYRFSSDQLDLSPYVSAIAANRDDHMISGFVQDKITLKPDSWFLTLGSKFEHNGYTGFEVQPNARLQWHPSKEQMLWGSVARAVRTPSRLEHDLSIDLATLPPGSLGPYPVNVQLQANREFDSEKLVAYELGYRHQWTPSLLLDIAVFYNDYTDLSTISLFPTSVINNGALTYTLLPVKATNGMSGDTYGIETVANWRVLNNVNISTTYSFLKIQLDGPPSTSAINAEAAERQSPRHQFNIRTQWDITPRLSLDNIVYYTSALSSYSVDAYIGLDMRLGFRLTDNVQLSLVGQNVLEPDRREFSNPTDVNATRINRSVYGNVTWRF